MYIMYLYSSFSYKILNFEMPKTTAFEQSNKYFQSEITDMDEDARTLVVEVLGVMGIPNIIYWNDK